MDLLGVWSLDREVREGDAVGRVLGELLIMPAAQGLRWWETGTLAMGGRRTPVSRETYLVGLDGDDPWMTFADGRPFHPWRPGEDVTHPCGEDLYVGRIDVDGDAMTTRWRVTGPGTDQLLTTSLRRRRPTGG